MSSHAAAQMLLADVTAAGHGDTDLTNRIVFGVLGVLGAVGGWMAVTGRWRSWVDDVRKTFFALSGPGYALFFLPYAAGLTDLPERSVAWALLAAVPASIGMVWVVSCFVLAPVFQFSRPRWMQPPWLRRGQEPPHEVMIAKARRGRGTQPENEEDSVAISAGQVWRYRTRPGEHASRARVLLVEDDPVLGAIVHARLDDLMVSNPHTEGGRSTWLGHVPITRRAFEASVIAVVGTAETAPDLEGYRLWREEQGGVFTTPLAEVVTTVEATLNGPEE